jgi:DNA polymerase-1
MMGQWLLNYDLGRGAGYKLKSAVSHFLKHEMITWDQVVGRARAHMIAPSKMAPYCADDALQCLKLGQYFMQEICELNMKKVFLELENPIATEVLPHMDEVGFAINRDFLRELKASYQAEMDVLGRDFYSLTGVEIGKDAQISVAMYGDLKWWPILPQFKRGKSGRISIDEKHRKAVELELKEDSKGYQALQLKNRYQRLSKIVSTYTQSMIARADRFRDGRIRSSWLQHGTVTGRFASRDPNLQNIPIRSEEGKQVRKAFVHEEGWTLFDADYSGADLRVFAHLCGDENMIAVFKSDDDNLHLHTAKECGVDYGTGKAANLGLIYEMGPKTLANNIGSSRERGNIVWQRWHNMFPRVRQYHDRQHHYLRRHGFVRTITNRIRRIDGLESTNSTRRFRAQHESVNTPAQGSVADIIKIAMRNLVRDWKDRGVLYNWYTGEGKAKLVSQVHDELILELRNDFAEEGANDVKRHMRDAVKLSVPLKTDGGFGSSWLEAH